MSVTSYARPCVPRKRASERLCNAGIPTMVLALSRPIAVALVLCLGAAAHAGGDPEAGRLKADACLGCHGIENYQNVYPTYHVPKLGGQSAAYIVSALKAYQAGDRTHATMHGQVHGLSVEDIADIAAYFSSLAEIE